MKKRWKSFSANAPMVFLGLVCMVCGACYESVSVLLQKEGTKDVEPLKLEDTAEVSLESDTSVEGGAFLKGDEKPKVKPIPKRDTDQWTFFTIADIQEGPEIGREAIRSMYTLDKNAVMLLEVGDLTHNALEQEYLAHHTALIQGATDAGGPKDHFNVNTDSFGPYTRFVAAVGNHETWSLNWYELWNKYLPGQRHLGVNTPGGIYFYLQYKNAVFIILDSNFPSKEQTKWLKTTLESEKVKHAKWKFVFFHEPVYPCNIKIPKAEMLEWVTLFEQNGVQLVVHGHSHTFERTCQMRNGVCANQGVTYLTASGGGTSYFRDVNATLTRTLSFGDRTDTYHCEEILEDYQTNWSHFCHFEVSECSVLMACYDHNYWNGGKMRHSHTFSACSN